MKEISEEKKQVLAAVDAGIKKLHTLDESITLYEVSHTSPVNLVCFYALNQGTFRTQIFHYAFITIVSYNNNPKGNVLENVFVRILVFLHIGWTRRPVMKR